MRILIIGGGAIADSTHIPAAKVVFGLENIILAEPNEAQANKLQKKHGILHLVSDYHSVLSDIDVCVICTPPHIHNMILRDCLAAGKHVLCEKPLAPSTAETAQILQSITNNQVVGMCHTYRLFNNRRHVRRLILDGFFGDDLSITINEGAPSGWPTVSGYCFKKEMVPGGVLYDNGIHTLDFILWCLGMPDSVEYEDDAMGGLESNAIVHFHCQNASVYVKFSRTILLSNTILIEGSLHKVSLNVFEMNNFILDGVEQVAPANQALDWSNIGIVQLQNFVDAINGKCSISCPVTDGLAVIGLLETCYAQKSLKSIEKSPIGGLKGKNVFVTGGTGFIGGALVEQLVLHEEAKVRVLVHNWSKAAYVSRFDVEFVQGDICNPEDMTVAMEGCDYLIHCALPGGDGHDEFVNNNVKAVEALMSAAQKNGIKHVVQLSSVVVHGENVPSDLTADSPLVSYGDTYADGKMQAELRFWQLLEEYHLHGSIVRPTYVWGPYSMWYTMYVVDQMRSGEFSWAENGRGICNAVYVGNVVDLCIRCCVTPAADKQAFIATDGTSSTWRDFYGIYMRELGFNPESYLSVPFQDTPRRCRLRACRNWLQAHMDSLMDKYKHMAVKSPKAAKIIYRSPRKILRLIRNQIIRRLPEMPATQLAIYSQSTLINIQKNKDVFGVGPRYSVEEGMMQTCEWLKFSDLNYK